MKLYGITGYKQAGKDTVGQLICRCHLPLTNVRHNFADALKEEVAKACGTTVFDIEKQKPAFRTILQWWGTDFRRKMSGDNYWLIKWLTKARTLPASVMMCTDVRFLNEARIIKEVGGTLIRVKNDRVKSDGHASETEQDLILCDVTIDNNGSLEELEKEVKTKLKL